VLVYVRLCLNSEVIFFQLMDIYFFVRYVTLRLPQIKSSLWNNTCHVKSIYIERKNLQTEKSKNQSLLTQPSRKCTFNYDLCQALLSANIPLNKLSNDCFRNFLEKYTSKSIPVESTLRKSYVAQCYEETMNNIKSIVKIKNCGYLSTKPQMWKAGTSRM